MTDVASYTGRVLTLCALAIGGLLGFAYYQRTRLNLSSAWTAAEPDTSVRAAWVMLVGPKSFDGELPPALPTRTVYACTDHACCAVRSISSVDPHWCSSAGMKLALRSLYDNVLIYHPHPVLLFFVRRYPADFTLYPHVVRDEMHG